MTNLNNILTDGDIAMGAKAMDDVTKGHKALANASSALTWLLCQVFHRAEFVAIVRDKKGTELSRESFSIWDYVTTPPLTASGSRDKAMQNARSVAILEAITGVAKPTENQIVCLTTCAPIAMGLMERCDETDVTLTKRGALTVPYRVMRDAPDAEDPKVKESEIADYEALADTAFILDGGKERSIEALKRRVVPKLAREPRTVEKKISKPEVITEDTLVMAAEILLGECPNAQDLVVAVTLHRSELIKFLERLTA